MLLRLHVLMPMMRCAYLLVLLIGGCAWAAFDHVATGARQAVVEEVKRQLAPSPIAPPCKDLAEHAAGCASGTGRCTKCNHPCPNGPPLATQESAED